MKIEWYGNGEEYWTIETISDLDHWRVIYPELFKEGVVRLHCRSYSNIPPEFRMMYCPTSIWEETHHAVSV